MNGYEPKYRPFRILKKFEVAGDFDRLKKYYPNATLALRRDGSSFGWYKRMNVVNVPSEAELAIFKSPNIAIEISQDPRGFDKRDSGVARSVKSSQKAAQDSKVMISKQKFATKEEERKQERKENSKKEQKKIGSGRKRRHKKNDESELETNEGSADDKFQNNGGHE